MRFLKKHLVIALFSACTLASSRGFTETRNGQTKIDFNRQVRPILAKHCYSCHGPDKAESGLRLSEFASATQKAESGEIAVRPNAPEQSELLVRLLSNDASVRMPPEGEAISDSNIEIIRQWITEGAEYTTHWSFQPIQNPAIPICQDSTWSDNAIDRFIQFSLEQSDLEPAKAASPRALIRRLYYSVLGLPPTLEEIEAFESDSSDAAYVQIVDRLLADPRMGERWARHWLDVVRYAETNSFERDGLKPNAWKYRDYVIQSFNRDKPYDRFLKEQLAGDELGEVSVETQIATGYYRLGIWDDEPADPLQSQFDGFDDLVTVTGQGMLGLTFNCARCHDHKIDPIPQKDYYQWVAFFRDVGNYGSRGDQKSANQIELSSPELKSKYQQLETELANAKKQMKALEKIGIEKMTGEDQRKTEGDERKKVLSKQLRRYLDESQTAEYDQLESQVKAIDAELKSLPDREFVLGLGTCDLTPPETHLLLRGSPLAEGDVVQPGFPKMFNLEPPLQEAFISNGKSPGRRMVLANWIVSEKNWFTARVIVNRIWQHHFGRGIVRSANNFGQLGDAPTHPKLLDWLASELIRNGWSLKPIHRAIVMSQSYRMSSAESPKGIAIDPANNLFWQFPMRRLSAEELRDSVLATSGDLNLEKHGPSIFPDIADEVKATQSQPGKGWSHSSESDRSRRSVYIHIKRSLIPPELSVFDFPETDTSCEARFLTTQAGQALGLLNGQFLQSQSQRFAERIRRTGATSRIQQIEQAIQFAYGRPATNSDIRRADSLMNRLRDEYQLNEQEQLKEYCLVLLNTNEFMYLD